MRALAGSVMTLVMLLSSSTSAQAQSLGQVFRRVNPSAVVIRTKEKEIATDGERQLASVPGIGSGVLREGRIQELSGTLP